MLSVAVFRFSQSSYITSEDISAISVCLELVDGLLATNVTIELMQGTANNVTSVGKEVFLNLSDIHIVLSSIQTKHSVDVVQTVRVVRKHLQQIRFTHKRMSIIYVY